MENGKQRPTEGTANTEERPKNVIEGVLRWRAGFGLVVILVPSYFLWSSLPDKTKTRIIGALLPGSSNGSPQEPPGDLEESWAGTTNPELRRAIAAYIGKAGQIDEAKARMHLEAAEAAGNVLAKAWLALAKAQNNLGIRKDRPTFENDKVWAAETVRTFLNQMQTMSDRKEGLAAYLIACCHQAGVGTRKDPSAAFHWFRRSSELGCVLAMPELARYYYLNPSPDGIVRFDQQEALKWLHDSKDGGSKRAYAGLGRFYETRGNDAVDHRTARDFYLEGVKAGDPLAMYRLARMYHHGRPGVEIDLHDARRLYNAAAAEGIEAAALALNHLPTAERLEHEWKAKVDDE
ncbi:MAG: tetratricopeptide repeat protein [Phycisphaerae bacterium]|jgi:TPR repeat protein